MGGVLERGTEQWHDLVETQQFDELHRGPEHQQTEHVQQHFVPVGDHLKLHVRVAAAIRKDVEQLQRGDVSVDEDDCSSKRQTDHQNINPAPEHGEVAATLFPERAGLLDDEEGGEDEKDEFAGEHKERCAGQWTEQIHRLKAMVISEAATLHQLSNDRANAKQIHLQMSTVSLSVTLARTALAVSMIDYVKRQISHEILIHSSAQTSE